MSSLSLSAGQGTKEKLGSRMCVAYSLLPHAPSQMFCDVKIQRVTYKTKIHFNMK